MTYTKRRSIIIGDQMWDKIGKLARKEDRSRSELVREALIDLMARRERKPSGNYDPVNDQITHTPQHN